MTEWFLREPGSSVAKSEDDPTALLIGGGKPDWVTLPPEVGGGRVKVLEEASAACPKCRDHKVRHLILDCEVHVAECPLRGFLWYKFREEPE